MVLDGWGIGRNDETNPIHEVKPKNLAWLEAHFPVTSLQASGIAVGLPWGEVGNSEVGHLTLGAGKVLYQHYPRITMAIRDNSFFKNPALENALAHAKKNGSAVNFIGLLSAGNVHASLEHLIALIKAAETEGVEAKLHLFADGKDSPPNTIREFLKKIPKDKLATLTGRYYAMDRNQNWQLTKAAYENITGQGGTAVEDFLPAIEATKKRGRTEEYLPPLRLGKEKVISENDALVFFNFREDSIRQLAEAFLLKGFDKFPVIDFKNIYAATMTRYEDKLETPVMFPPETVESPLGKIISDSGKNQLRIAETYKYAHVTYFFNGYREAPFRDEYRTLIPSLTTARIEDRPEMMASSITDRLIDAVQTRGFDFILANYANPDTIAHTANYEAATKAVGAIDREIGRLLQVAINPHTTLIITSDHGNIEEMMSPTTALPESQHDASPVPFYLVAPEFMGGKFLNWRAIEAETMGSLADVAPTVLELIGIPQPKDMTGRSLLEGLI